MPDCCWKRGEIVYDGIDGTTTETPALGDGQYYILADRYSNKLAYAKLTVNSEGKGVAGPFIDGQGQEYTSWCKPDNCEV